MMNNMVAHQQIMFPAVSLDWPSESKVFNEKFSGLKVNVYQNSMNAPNAYTIPALKTKEGATVATNTGSVGSLIYFIYASKELAKNQLKAQAKSNGKVLFKAPPKYEMSLWETKGLISLIPEPDIRRAIMLHEVGHWVEYTPIIICNILNSITIIMSLIISIGVFNHIILPYFFALIIPIVVLSTLYARSAEYKADAFVKRMGYGNELIEGFKRMGYSKRSNVSVLVQLEDMIRVISMKVIDIVDIFLPIFGHPSMRKRIMALKENNIIFPNQYDIIEEGLLPDINKALIYPLKKLLKPIDDLASKNVKTLFPLARR